MKHASFHLLFAARKIFPQSLQERVQLYSMLKKKEKKRTLNKVEKGDGGGQTAFTSSTGNKGKKRCRLKEKERESVGGVVLLCSCHFSGSSFFTSLERLLFPPFFPFSQISLSLLLPSLYLPPPPFFSPPPRCVLRYVVISRFPVCLGRAGAKIKSL